MAEPMATKAELAELRKRGMEATPKNIRLIQAIMQQNKKNNKMGGKAPAGGMSKKNISMPSSPAGKYNKGGMVKKANCGASVPPARKGK